MEGPEMIALAVIAVLVLLLMISPYFDWRDRG
jgi:hypothetical protein